MNLARNLPAAQVNFKQFLHPPCPNNLFMFPTTENEVSSVIRAMKPKTSSGHDNISPKLLQEIYQGILYPLTHIINLSLKHGCVPDQMKLAKVIPIYKSGDKQEIVNYRPISLLPTFSKILERIVYRRLYSFLSANKILASSQYGFRESRSTELAILELQNRIAHALSSGDWCLGVFLDLSKAFDTINHSILLEKLSSYGVRGLALSWFESYLSSRKQFTSISVTHSEQMFISCGVPQGSILGPLLFLVYVNDINNAIKTGHPILFADDTNLLFMDKNLNRVKVSVNKEMVHISQWFIVNKLSINVAKTKFIIFHRKRQNFNNENLSISINNTKLEKVQTMKFLGIIIDENLSWKCHIDHICKKIGKALGVLHRIRHLVPEHIMLKLYNTLIMSHMNYAISVYGSSDNCNLKRVLTMQKKAIRCLSNSPYNGHCNPLFVKYKLLNIYDMHAISCVKLAFLSKRGALPDYHLQELAFSNQMTIATRQIHDFYIPTIRSKYAKQCLKNKVGYKWNLLPINLKKYNRSSHAFIRKVKAHYLTQYNVLCTKAKCHQCQKK